MNTMSAMPKYDARPGGICPCSQHDSGVLHTMPKLPNPMFSRRMRCQPLRPVNSISAVHRQHVAAISIPLNITVHACVCDVVAGVVVGRVPVVAMCCWLWLVVGGRLVVVGWCGCCASVWLACPRVWLVGVSARWLVVLAAWLIGLVVCCGGSGGGCWCGNVGVAVGGLSSLPCVAR